MRFDVFYALLQLAGLLAAIETFSKRAWLVLKRRTQKKFNTSIKEIQRERYNIFYIPTWSAGIFEMILHLWCRMQPFQSVIYDINKNVYSTPQSAWSPFSHIKYNNKNMFLDTEVPGFVFLFVIRPDKTMSYTATIKARISCLLEPVIWISYFWWHGP